MATIPITLRDEPVWCYRMEAGNMHFSRCHQIRMTPSWCYKQNRDSSEIPMSLHSCVQVCHWTRHWRHSCLWCNVKGNQSHDRQTGSPCCCNRRCTVISDISYLHSSKWSHFLVQGSWCGCTVHEGHACKLSVFSVYYRDGRLLRSITAFLWPSLTRSLTTAMGSQLTGVTILWYYKTQSR